MNAHEDQERRHSGRVQCRLEAQYRLPAGELHSSQARDISDGGILLVVSGGVKEGDLLEIDLPLTPGSEPLKARGRVLHIRERQNKSGQTERLAGIVFLNLTEGERKALGLAVWRQILRESTRFGPTP